MTEKQLAGCIESTLLSATTTEEQIRQLCQQAADYSFVGVCVNPRWVSFAADELTRAEPLVDLQFLFKFFQPLFMHLFIHIRQGSGG